MNGLVRILPYALAFFSSLCIMVLELVAGRLVAPHVGASLSVWTSVIGIMLGGICLGNVLGGRLADRVEPRRAIGPLYALGAALTLGALWVNAVVGMTPGLDSLTWNLRTVVVVTLDFLVPATVLGMIGPVVAKMAVEQARRSGTALGDVYSLGAVGSIVGTFLAGFYLIYFAPTSSIVTVVASALALLAAALLVGVPARFLALAASVFLALGSIAPVYKALPARGLALGAIVVNPLALVGHALALVLTIVAVVRLSQDRVPAEIQPEPGQPEGDGPRVKLGDLAALSFVASLAFMALEMVAGRLVTRHLGSSVFGWTSVIGVLLGGLSIGNYLGGRIANAVQNERHLSWLFLVASILTMTILPMETPPKFVTAHVPWLEAHTPILSEAITMHGFSWWPFPWSVRVLVVVAAVFFLPSIAMGTVSPVVAKLAVDRVKRSKRTGAAIGQVYAWGMVGSILGTFLAGFVLIDVLGTKGLLLALAATLALASTLLGSIWHAAWAGIPLGLCVIAFGPVTFLKTQGLNWGIREDQGDPNNTEIGLAYADESDYYYIKVNNQPVAYGYGDANDEIIEKRTLILDNLIHGYFWLGHPEHIEYDYEFIYAQVAHRAAVAKAKAQRKADAHQVPLKTMFLGGGSYTFPRYLQHTYAGTSADVAEIDPAVTEANHAALGLARDTPIQTTWGDARQYVERHQGRRQYDLIFGDAFNDFSVPWHLTTKEFNDKIANLLAPDGIYMINIIDIYRSDEQAREDAVAELEDEAEAKANEQAKREGMNQASPSVIAAAQKQAVADPQVVKSAQDKAVAKAHGLGGFLGSWVNTARKTFGNNIYVFGTDDTPGTGLRETFVVVASKKPLDLAELGRRFGDPKFMQRRKNFEPNPYAPEHMKALNLRSRGIILTDDYAPVENLLAPVAETRAKY